MALLLFWTSPFNLSIALPDCVAPLITWSYHSLYLPFVCSTDASWFLLSFVISRYIPYPNPTKAAPINAAPAIYRLVNIEAILPVVAALVPTPAISVPNLATSATALPVRILPNHWIRVPILLTPAPAPVVNLPKTDRKGPIPNTANWTVGGNLLNHNIISPNVFTTGLECCKTSANLGNNCAPISMAIFWISFLAIWILLALVWYLILASLVKAVFSFQPLFAISKALPNPLSPSSAPESLFMASASRIPVTPNDASTSLTLPPLSFTFLRPLRTNPSASTGRLLKALANSPALTPAALANLPKFSPPDITAFCIFVITCVIALPPASASIPTVLIAAANPNTSASDILVCLPIPESRCDISTIDFSLVAKLFPNSTNVEPRFLILLWLVPITAMNWAKLAAPSSLLKFVVAPKSAIVFVKSTMFSVLIPNCPATSPILANSFALTGISVERFKKLCLILSNCCGVASTVLTTPAKSLSKLIALLAANNIPEDIPAVALVKPSPTPDIFCPRTCALVPTSLNLWAVSANLPPLFLNAEWVFSTASLNLK